MASHRGAERSYFVDGLKLPDHIRRYLDAVVQTCTQVHSSLVSIVLFGSIACGGYSNASDVDLVVVLPDDVAPEMRRRVRHEITRLEISFGLRPVTSNSSRGWRWRVERAAGHLFPCCVCTRQELLSGDVGSLFELRRWEALFVDRILLASIVTSAVTIFGEQLIPLIPVPPVRRLDVFKTLLMFACQIVLSILVYPVLPDATKYAMGALKHSVHSCYFCYHHRSARLNEEIAFFNRRFGPSRALTELFALRRQCRPSFWFIVRSLTTVVSLHLRTARDFAGLH